MQSLNARIVKMDKNSLINLQPKRRVMDGNQSLHSPRSLPIFLVMLCPEEFQAIHNTIWRKRISERVCSYFERVQIHVAMSQKSGHI